MVHTPVNGREGAILEQDPKTASPVDAALSGQMAHTPGDNPALDAQPTAGSLAGSYREPLLAGGAAPSHTIDIVGDAKTEAYVNRLMQEAPLPKKANWGHAPSAIFATLTTAAASYLYALGGSKLGTEYVVGGVGINIPQNMLYGFGTADFFKNVWGRCLTATGLGITATLPSSIAAWKLSNGSYFTTGLTFIGNLPNNIYGMYDAVKRPLDYADDNPKLRKYLLDKFRNSLPEEQQSLLMDERATATVVAGNLLGVLMGTGLVGAQTGYVCSATEFMTKYFGKSAGVALGILADSPCLLIAFLISGLDLGKSTVNLTADLYRHLSGEKKLELTRGDKNSIAALLGLVAACSWFAYRSSGTSQSLYDGSCPDFGDVGSNVLRHDIQEGSEIFNEILMGKFFVNTLGYLKTAYSNNDESRDIYRIRAIEQFLLTASRADLEKIAMEHYPDELEQWKTKPAPKTSFCGSVAGFFCRKKTTPAEAPAEAQANVQANAAAPAAQPSGYFASARKYLGFGYGNPQPVQQPIKPVEPTVDAAARATLSFV
jgi:hypothetical protein